MIVVTQFMGWQPSPYRTSWDRDPHEVDETKTGKFRSPNNYIVIENPVENATDHFRNFHGFGNDGRYVTHYRSEPGRATVRMLEEAWRGKKVRIVFPGIADYRETPVRTGCEVSYKRTPVNVPSVPIQVPLNGSLGYPLQEVRADTIGISIPRQAGVPEDRYFEMQKITICGQSVSELRDFS